MQGPGGYIPILVQFRITFQEHRFLLRLQKITLKPSVPVEALGSTAVLEGHRDEVGRKQKRIIVIRADSKIRIIHQTDLQLQHSKLQCYRVMENLQRNSGTQSRSSFCEKKSYRKANSKRKPRPDYGRIAVINVPPFTCTRGFLRLQYHPLEFLETMEGR
ncbi:hypothetical protein TNCT_243331 [Trichonephila clavata]|uniref:Uncharacterized protein n=1 Tax=Trichonephila clavata TaxID=2740835 RepID=A0A8X6H7M0_TRICU|nr:hypothetical protein TNCT_243331 [Trichonephila clavata]